MGHKVALRDVIDEDLPFFFEHQADQGAAAMVGLPSRDRPTFEAHWAKIRKDPAGVIRTIVADEQVAGHAVSFLKDGQREVGYWLDRAWWGKGVASAGLALLLELEARRPLHAYVLKTNVGSRRVLEKNGFAFQTEDDEGLLLILT